MRLQVDRWNKGWLVLVCCFILVVPLILFFPLEADTEDRHMAFALRLVGQMNLTEKITFLHGVDGPYIGNIAANERLGIPSLTMNDGPQGFRTDFLHRGTTTAFPCAMNIAATFNPSLAYAWGHAMGAEFAMKGAHILLGPGVNVARVPLNGRNFEYISGEDPVLGARMARAAVEGIQVNGVMANAKHYVNNNQEMNRENVSAWVDERTEMEIYIPPFEGAIKGGVLTMMCAYNRVNGIWACEDDNTLNKILRGRLGFKGWVMSDWDATHSTVQSLTSGLDVEMPANVYFGAPTLAPLVRAGQVDESLIDDKVARVLATMHEIGVVGNTKKAHMRPKGDIAANVTNPAHSRLARTLAARSTVVVKNENHILPLSPSKFPRGIAVLGNAGHDIPVVGGLGSGYVDPPYIITGLEGIRERVADMTAAAASRASAESNNNNNRRGGPFGGIVGGVNVGGGVGGKSSSSSSATPPPVTYHPTLPMADAVAAAKNADVAVVFVATVSGEHADRFNLSYPSVEDELVLAVAAVQPNTIVVATSPGHVLMPWSTKVAAIVMCFLPGQEAGNGIADILFNVVAPTAHLPITIPNKENEMSFTPAQYPGLPITSPPLPLDAHYTEGLRVGYRWYEAGGVRPLYCFGHGLSYTEFNYSDLTIQYDERHFISVTAFITNAGNYSSSDTPQLYLTFPRTSGEPPRQLKGFQPTQMLRIGERQRVGFALRPRDMSIWDVGSHDWKLIVNEEFTLDIGRSSCDLRLQGKFVVPDRWKG